MIPICFPQDVYLRSDGGEAIQLLASGAAPTPDRIYLVLNELLEQMVRDCKNNGIAVPVRLPESLLASPHRPARLADILRAGQPLKRQEMRICLFNGGGGGLGDAIMFAPALRILSERLRQLGVTKCRLDVFSMFAGRTAVIFQGLADVRVRPLPLSLQEFLQYDAYVDYSGMLLDQDFQQSHMTDFALGRMGIDPASVADREKAPFLNLDQERPPALEQAISNARQAAGNKPLVAVIFRSSLTRTMPDCKAAGLCEVMAQAYQPVILLPSREEARQFVIRNVLSSTVIDLSEHSTSFMQYMLLLQAMDGLVSVDTSAVHIGGALHKPTVAIFNSINHAYRTRYSPTVTAMQLPYRGKSCQAPCGLSKITSFVEGKLGSGRQFRLEFGHACDEAIDKNQLLDEVIGQINAGEAAGTAEANLAAIQAQAAPKFSGPPAPCWEKLKINDVLRVLHQAMGGR